MNGLEQNPAMAVLSQDDGAIEDAINDLDAKIAAWVDAMNRASAALAQVTRAECAAPRNVEVPAPPSTAEPVIAEDAAPQDVSAEALSGVVTLPGGNKSKKPIGLKAKLLKLGGSPKSSEQKPETAPVDEAPTSPVIAEKSQQELEDEDEALLARLDPKVAKSIRIKRRLSRGKKSVRELINEMQK
jgi:hypothetical protein